MAEVKEKLSEQDLTLANRLGEGNYGVVMKGKLRQKDAKGEEGKKDAKREKDVAIKVLNSNICQTNLMKEVKFMRQFMHTYVVQVLAVCKPDDKTKIYIVTELMEMSLLGYLERNGCRMKLKTRVKIAAKIAAGMEYLASNKIVHGNLAARNVLIGHDNRDVKVADFGLARTKEDKIIYLHAAKTSKPIVPTYLKRWTAPEVESNAHTFTTTSDVWSYGVVMWEIFANGQQPYPGMSDDQVLPWLRHGNRMWKPENCLADVYQIMLKCWNTQQSDRPSFSELLLFCDEYRKESLQERIRNILSQLHRWVSSTKDAAAELYALADEMDEHFRRISKAKVGGSIGAVVGGVIAGVGFGLSFFTFGASLGLVVAGGVIGGVGGATAGGAAIADIVLSLKRKKAAEKAFEAYNDTLKDICEECVSIGNILHHRDDVDNKYKGWVSFWSTLLLGSGSAAKNVGWQAVASSIIAGLRISSQTGNIGRAGVQTGATVFRTIGTTAGRAAHVAGGVAGLLLLPVDIALLVDAAIDVHKDNPHKMSEYLREVAGILLEKCPSKKEIDQMISETLRKLNS